MYLKLTAQGDHIIKKVRCGPSPASLFLLSLINKKMSLAQTKKKCPTSFGYKKYIYTSINSSLSTFYLKTSTCMVISGGPHNMMWRVGFGPQALSLPCVMYSIY